MKARSILRICFALSSILWNGCDVFAAPSASGVWSSQFGSPPGANGPVRAFATVGTNLYVAGAFTQIADIHARHIARFDGQTWSEVGGGVQEGDWPWVFALCGDGTNLYIGGKFSKVGGIAATNIAKWTGEHWEALGNGILGWIDALYSDRTNLYVGGSFSSAGGIDTANIARWTGQRWEALGEGLVFSVGTEQNLATVTALAGDGMNVYAGGQFVSAGSIQTTNLARWDGSRWHEVATGFSDPYGWNSPVSSLAWHQDALYVGGNFRDIMGMTATGFAKWDGMTWNVPAIFEGAPTPPAVKTILSVGDKLYVGGNFDHANGETARNVIVLDHDEIVAAPGPVVLNNYDAAHALGALGDRIFFGGNFLTEDSAAANLVELTDRGIKPVVARVANDVPYESRALATDGTNIFVAGNFRHVGTNSRLAVAKWNGTNWLAAAPAIYPEWTINHLAVIGSNIFVAGDFRSEELGVTNLAWWTGGKWKTMGRTSTAAVDSMVALDGKLYVTGTFSDTATSCKVWNGTNWTRVTWFPQTEYGQRLTTDGTNLYIARGGFRDPATGNLSTKVARWTGSQAIVFGGELPLVTPGAIAVTGTNIFVSGSKTFDPNAPHNCLFRWNGAGWTEWADLVDVLSDIRAMTSLGQNIVIAGNFSTLDGALANGISLWDGSRWRPLDTGLTTLDQPGSVMDLVVLGNRLFVTGSFDQAGVTSSGNIAMWTQMPDIQFLTPQPDTGMIPVAGEIGARVEVEASDSLTNWTRITELQFSGGTEHFSDPFNSSHRFYRAKIVEP